MPQVHCQKPAAAPPAFLNLTDAAGRELRASQPKTIYEVSLWDDRARPLKPPLKLPSCLTHPPVHTQQFVQVLLTTPNLNYLLQAVDYYGLSQQLE